MRSHYCGTVVVKGNVEAASHVLEQFPERYQHYFYSYTQSYWKCDKVDQFQGIVYQLVDRNFEPPRGNVRSDAPFIYVRCEQDQDNVIITYKLKWQKWKVFFVWVIALCFFSSGLLICKSHLPVEAGLLTYIWLFFLLGCAVWLVKNIRHDRITIRLFHELIMRNLYISP